MPAASSSVPSRDSPVVQASKFELMLGLTVPPSLLAIADEVIE